MYIALAAAVELSPAPPQKVASLTARRPQMAPQPFGKPRFAPGYRAATPATYRETAFASLGPSCVGRKWRRNTLESLKTRLGLPALPAALCSAPAAAYISAALILLEVPF
jgi:hypothetical protein